MTAPLPRLLPCGDTAIAVEFGSTVDPDLNGLVLALDAALAAAPPPGFIESVPTYRSLLVQFDPLVFDHGAFARWVAETAPALKPMAGSGRRWRIPVVYGGEYGIDLADVAAHHGISPEEVIARHAAGTYRVYMIGFLPGFSYLGGLDPRLAIPRRTNPRAWTPAGTISIGGVQAIVASVAAPSGWHLLGRTPVRTFMPEREPVFLLQAGDEIRFEPVPESRWAALEAAAAAGEPVAERLA